MSLTSVARQKDFISRHKQLNYKEKQKFSYERAHNEYLAKKILNDIRNWKTVDLVKASYFNKLELFDFPSICVLFNKFLDQSIKQDLLNLVLLSRSSKDIDIACSNAITILAKSDFSFNDIDLNNIRIPKADLSQCLLINVNFENSNLKEVKFLQSHLYKVNFKNCDLSSAKIGFVMEINSQNGKGLCFSANNDYFYYKTDEKLMEVNLKNQEIKFKAVLSDVVSSHITNILRAKDNKYFSKLNGKYLEIYEQKLAYKIDMTKIEFSSNWKYIAAITNKSFVVCWDSEKQRLGATNTTTYQGTQLSFVPCSNYLAIIKRDCIYLIETKSWTRIKKIRGKFSKNYSLAFSYFGRKIALNDFDRVILIDVFTEKKDIIYINKATSMIQTRGLSFSPCGRFLAFESNESSILVVDINLGNITQIFTGFKSNVISVLFSNSGKYISLSDSKGNIKIYEFFPRFIKNDYNRHLKLLSVNISPKGTYLLTKSIEKSVLWDLSDFKPKQVKTFFYYRLYEHYVFSPSETYLAIRKHPKYHIYDIKHNCWLISKNVNRWCFYMTFSHCEKYLICLTNVNCYEYFRISDMEMVRKIDSKITKLQSIEFSKCGKFHCWNDINKNLLIWDLERENFIDRIVLEKYYVRYAFSSLLNLVAIVKEKIPTKECVEILDRNSGERFLLKAKGESIKCCSFSQNQKYLATGYESGVIIIWDIKTESIREKFRSLLCRSINMIEVVNNSIIIRENDNVEIFKSNRLC